MRVGGPGPHGTVVAGVHKRFGRGPWVLRGLDLVVEPGTISEVAGANGSGKSTLLRIVAGLTPPSQGRVQGRPAAVGYAPERLPARLRMSGRAYVGHMARLRGLPAGPFELLLDRLGLAPGPDVPIGTLSKGNSQKVALAQALAPPVGLLLLDEPASGLDQAGRAVLAEVLAERRSEGVAVLLATHAPIPGLRADARWELRAGQVQAAPAVSTPMVRIELVARADGRRRVITVGIDASDAALVAAVADGWSVVSVTPV